MDEMMIPDNKVKGVAGIFQSKITSTRKMLNGSKYLANHMYE